MRTSSRSFPALMASTLLAAALSQAANLPTLLDAAKQNNPAAIRAELANNADPNQPGPDGATALHWVAYHDDLATADLLIAAGAQVNAKTDLMVTPLWTAAQNASPSMVAKLLAAGADPDPALESGETALMVAARSGSAEAVRLLAEAGADVNATASRNQTALMWAAAQSHPDVVQVLIEHGANIHARSDEWVLVMAVPPHSYEGYNLDVPHGRDTPLLFAARVGDLASVKHLVAAGANVNDADAWGVTAVSYACHSGFTDMVLYLLDQGADPNLADPGFAPIHEAILRRDERMVAALLEHGADPNAILKTWTPSRRSSNDWNFDPALVGASPLWIATRFAEPGIMQMLLDHGAEPNFVHHVHYVATLGFGQDPREERTTLLMAATGLGRAGDAWIDLDRDRRESKTLEAVKLALELGADVNARGLDGRTALDGARQLRMASVIEFLASNGAQEGVPQPTRGPRPQ